jgi:hypothetical protein
MRQTSILRWKVALMSVVVLDQLEIGEDLLGSDPEIDELGAELMARERQRRPAGDGADARAES